MISVMKLSRYLYVWAFYMVLLFVVCLPAYAKAKVINNIDTFEKLQLALTDQETDVAGLAENSSIYIDKNISIGQLKGGMWKKISHRPYSDITIKEGATLRVATGSKLSIGDPYYNQETDETLYIYGTLIVDGGWLSIGSTENRYVVINNGTIIIKTGSRAYFGQPYDVDDPYEPKMEWGKTSEGSIILEAGAIIAAQEETFIDQGTTNNTLYVEEMVEVRNATDAPDPSYLTAGEYHYDPNSNAFVKR